MAMAMAMAMPACFQSINKLNQSGPLLDTTTTVSKNLMAEAHATHSCLRVQDDGVVVHGSLMSPLFSCKRSCRTGDSSYRQRHVASGTTEEWLQQRSNGARPRGTFLMASRASAESLTSEMIRSDHRSLHICARSPVRASIVTSRPNQNYLPMDENHRKNRLQSLRDAKRMEGGRTRSSVRAMVNGKRPINETSRSVVSTDRCIDEALDSFSDRHPVPVSDRETYTVAGNHGDGGREFSGEDEPLEDVLQLIKPKRTYEANLLDDWYMTVFRRALSTEVGWDSDLPGYDGLMEVVKRMMMKSGSPVRTEEAAFRTLSSLFPSWLTKLFSSWITKLGDGRPAAVMCAWTTKAAAQWLMGPCDMYELEMADGSKLWSGVLVERCKYLEEAKCKGMCVHTCKIPTQSFMALAMGVPLAMEPNYDDFSCKFQFGVEAKKKEDDESLRTPCYDSCPNATTFGEARRQCPQVGLPLNC